jgi:putative GTP pyrophosphokinase
MASLDFEQEKVSFREYYNARYPLFADAVTSYQNLLTLLLADRDAFPTPKVVGRVKEREECIGKFARKYLKKCEDERTPYEIKGKGGRRFKDNF